MDTLLFGAMLLGAAVAYLVPAVIASRRKHRNANAIFIINLFFGWTFLGWVISLAWALTNNTEQAGRMEAPARS